LIDFRQRQPCISGISTEEGRIFCLGEIFTTEGGGFCAVVLRGDDFLLRGDDFPVRGEDFPQSAKNQRYVRFPRNFAWWSPWTCLTKENCKNRLLIDFRQRQPCISGISAEGWEFFAEGRYLPLREEDFFAEGGWFFAARGWFSGEWGGFSAERQKSRLCPIPTQLCMVIPMDMPNKRKMQKQVIDWF
jgi:hypothetical protein